MFHSGPKYQKLTTNLRLAINRLKLLEKKKTELAVKARKEIADYLVGGKEERARIRVEHIIREDYLVEAMELIEMFCDLLLARMGLIQTSKELDPGLEEPIASIIWATPRLIAEVQELKVVTEQLTAKYGKEFAQQCQSNNLENVNEKLMHKLSVRAPPRLLVDKYLEEIAKTYNVPYTPDPGPPELDVMEAEGLLIDFNNEKKGGGGGGGGGMAVMQPQHQPQAASVQPQPYNPNPPFSYPSNPAVDARQPPPLPSVPPAGGSSHGSHAPAFTMPPPPPANYESPPVPPPGVTTSNGPTEGGLGAGYNYDSLKKPPASATNAPSAPSNDVLELPELPSVPAGSVPGATSAGGEDVDFDDLTRRFEQLKKKK